MNHPFCVLGITRSIAHIDGRPRWHWYVRMPDGHDYAHGPGPEVDSSDFVAVVEHARVMGASNLLDADRVWKAARAVVDASKSGRGGAALMDAIFRREPVAEIDPEAAAERLAQAVECELPGYAVAICEVSETPYGRGTSFNEAFFELPAGHYRLIPWKVENN